MLSVLHQQVTRKEASHLSYLQICSTYQPHQNYAPSWLRWIFRSILCKGDVVQCWWCEANNG